MNFNKTMPRRALSMLLAFALVLPAFLALVGKSGSAEAAISLPHIEKLKQAGGIFKILEIAPNADEGSLGYYIPGQEPSTRQMAKAGAKDKEARESYAADLLDDLKRASLMGKGQDTPLTSNGTYTEYFPWDTNLPAGNVMLLLDHNETTDVKGTFSPAEAGAGAFKENKVYKIDANGNYAQIITGLKPNPITEPAYYYDIEFRQFKYDKDKTTEIPNGTLVYSVIPYNDTTTIPDLTTKDGAPENLKCMGVVGYEAAGLDINGTHYMAIPKGAPSATYDDKIYKFRAEGTEFRKVAAGETGYFSAAASSYTYVGSGGTHNFTQGSSTAIHVFYDSLYFTPGYTNNDWFMKYVFDWEPEKNEARPKLSFDVRTLAGNDVTSEQIKSAVGTSPNLVVLSSGFLPNRTATAFSTANDISKDVKTAIQSAVALNADGTSGIPVIADLSITDKSLNMGGLIAELAKNKQNGFVEDTIFGYKGKLATKSFNAKITGAYTQVSKEIEEANKLRQAATPKLDKLPTEVTMARAIRAIISRSGHVASKEKTAIKVLEIQPGKLGELDKDTVLAWLNKPAGSTTPKIDITVRSTAELIGSIESILEEYDLVYIGSSLAGLNTSADGTKTNYNDDNMDGLIYTNIGDTVVSGGDRSGHSLSGLLDRDYTNTAYDGGYHYLKSNDESRTFRYSGNDLTPGKMQELMSYANAGYPIVVADDLATDKTFDGKKTDGEAKFVLVLPCKFSTDLQYDAKTQKLKVSVLSNVFEGQIDMSMGRVSQAKYTLYKDDEEVKTVTGGESYTFDNISEGNYHVVVEAVKITTIIDLVEHPVRRGRPAITEKVSVKKGTSTYSIDDSSHMYAFLSGDFGFAKPNVMSVAEAAGHSADLGLYVNLSKPKLELSKRPEPYKRDENGVEKLEPQNGSYYLEYEFKITNATDPDPANTRYTAKLYTDSNADGRYRENEQLSDAIIRKGSAGDVVSASELEADTEYSISRKLPPEKVGIIPWKLEVLKTGAGKETICASEHNYTYVPPNGKVVELNILQINTSRTGKTGINLEQQQQPESGGYEGYGGIYGKLLADVKSDYNVKIKTLTTTTIETPKNWNRTFKNANNEDEEKIYTNLQEFIDSYDMLIIGFDDNYRELSKTTAEAIEKYIQSGKATLFTHDTASFRFLPYTEDNNYKTDKSWALIDDYVYTMTGDYPPSNYYFNTLLRSAVGLDRYGVADANYGRTKMSNPTPVAPEAVVPKIVAPGTVASDSYISMNDQQKEVLTDAGYSIAYKPKSHREQTVAETQGLTSGVLMRFYQSGGKPTNGRYETKFPEWWEVNGKVDHLDHPDNPDNPNNPQKNIPSVSQVNEGQITTYPFDVNTELFKPNAAANATNFMTIAPTHCQYQQLNMNSDDVVVWYCLSGGTFNYLPNDVVNSYYIYSKGNVTYSGVGHTTDPAIVNAKEAEAKLFVNTMIAAYRVANVAPEISFTDATGKIPLDNFMVPADGDVLKPEMSKKTNTDRNIYFTINDFAAKNPNKKLTVQFNSCMPHEVSENNALKVKIYYTDTSGEHEVTNETPLVSGLTYYIKLDDITADIADGGTPITATFTSEIDGVKKTGTDTLTLRKLQLFNLS